jgi:hypothetical protein
MVEEVIEFVFVSLHVYIIRAPSLVFVGTSTYLSPDFVYVKTIGKLIATSKVALNWIWWQLKWN